MAFESPAVAAAHEPFGMRAAADPWGSPAPASAAMLACMLDAVDYGMLLVRDGDRLAYCNRSARAALLQDHPLQLTGQRLAARHPRDTAALRDALEGAMARGLQKLLTLGVRLEQRVGVAVLPFAAGVGVGPAHAIVMLGKRAVCGELSTQAFARQHGLTPAELRVLEQLCAGQQPAEIARLQGVALTTVRTQIGSIRDKTGAANIGALIRSVARLPPLMSRTLMAPAPDALALALASPAPALAQPLHGVPCPGPRSPKDSRLISTTST